MLHIEVEKSENMVKARPVPTAAEIEAILVDATRRLVDAAHPQKIILFGSYARGDYGKDSDLDFLVILPEVQERVEEMVRLRDVLRGIPLPIDVIVYSADQVAARRELRGTMLYHALREGRVLYDAA